MDSMSMITTAAVLFGIAAAGGVLMALIRFGGADRPPSSITMLHGILAAGGLTLLLYAGLVSGISATAWAATGILIVVALVGTAINLMYHSKMRPLPKPAVLVHGAVAAVGLGVLIVAILHP